MEVNGHVNVLAMSMRCGHVLLRLISDLSYPKRLLAKNIIKINKNKAMEYKCISGL